MNALMASGPGSEKSNPRSEEYLSSKNITLDAKGNHSFWDPHGNLYNIIFDTNGDGAIDDPFTGVPILKKVLICSDGPDGKSSTPDDVKSW